MEKLREIIDSKSFVVLGVGNPERGDDGVGNYVVSKLNTKRKIDCGNVPENFTRQIRDMNPEIILIVDAVDFGGKAGEKIFTKAENAKGAALSTHSLPLSVFCKLFPESKSYIIGIQPDNFAKISEKIKTAGDGLAKELNSILK